MDPAGEFHPGTKHNQQARAPLTESISRKNALAVTYAYFFLKPAGQTGFAPVTFLLVLPFTQVIVMALVAAGFAGAVGVAGVGVAVAGAEAAGAVVVMASLALNLIESLAWLKVNPCAVNLKY